MATHQNQTETQVWVATQEFRSTELSKQLQIFAQNFKKVALYKKVTFWP